MMQNELILLKTFLLSTSMFNIRKYSSDSKKKKKVAGAVVGRFFLILLLVVYTGLLCVGYGAFGMADAIPAACAMIVSVLAFFFTVFKVNGYIFTFKEYDMIMSLPFEIKSVVRAKFMYMYIKSIIWYLAIALTCLVGYAIFAKPSVMVYILWVIFSFLLPIGAMVLATVVGYIIARISSGFKAARMMQTILSFAFILLAFSLRFIIEGIFKDGKSEDTFAQISVMIDNAGSFYWPIKWFAGTMTELRISDTLLFLAFNILLVELVMTIVSRSYRKINSSLMTNAIHRKFDMKSQKVKSIVNAIAFKEYRRMTGSNIYMVNVLMGEVFSVILALASLIFGLDSIVAIITNGAPIPDGVITPLIPFIIYFFIGMVPSTVCSPSLEGKNYWIVQSLPISRKELYQGKILFNLYLTVPFTLLATLCMCISVRVSIVDTVIYIITGMVMCVFSSVFGLACGIKFMRLDWENEVEVIKQGTGVVLYLFPNMLLTMILGVVVVALGFLINTNIVLLAIIALYSLLAFIFYKSLKI